MKSRTATGILSGISINSYDKTGLTMKTPYRIIFGLLLVMLAYPGQTFAQENPDTTTVWLVETRDGNSFMGKIAREDTAQLLLHTEIYGPVRIPIPQIRSRTVVEQSELVEGQLWFSNPHATRSFFGPNGYGLKAGEAYYQNTWVFFNQLSYGITDYFSMGGGVMPLFLIAGSPTPVWITPKISIPLVKDKLNLGAGTLLAWVIGEDSGFGIGYGALTMGGRDKNLTLGAGWAFSGGEWADAPTLMLSGMARVSKKTYLITENYLIGLSGSSFGILSAGGRSVQKRLAVDYGLVFPVGAGMDTFVAIPWLGIAVPFGNRTNQ